MIAENLSRFASGKSIVLVVCRKCSLEKQSEMLDKLLDQVYFSFAIHLKTVSLFEQFQERFEVSRFKNISIKFNFNS